MKNIAVFSVLVIIIGQIFPENNERNYDFLIGAQTGFIYGKTLELVYPSNTPADLLSELIWDIKPVFYYGIFLDFKQNDMLKKFGFYSSLSFKAGIPNISGNIVNRDWTSIENEALTHYSIHTNKTKQLYLLDFTFGLSFPLSQKLYILPHLHFSWMHFSFSGRDGHGIYARNRTSNTYFPNDDNPRLINFEGEVIRYMQNWLILSFGLEIGLKLSTYFSLDFYIRISPLTYCAAVDNHLDPSKVITYRDYTRFGIYAEPAIGLHFNANKFNISFNAAYRHIGKTVGPSYFKEENNNTFYRGGRAGAALSIIDCSLLFGFSF